VVEVALLGARLPAEVGHPYRLVAMNTHETICGGHEPLTRVIGKRAVAERAARVDYGNVV
jgi:hypothetical protein